MQKIIYTLVAFALLTIFFIGYAMGAKFGAKTIVKKEYIKDTIYSVKTDTKIDTIYRPAVIDTNTIPYVAIDTTEIRTQGLNLGTLITKYTYLPQNSFTYYWDIQPVYKDVHIVDTVRIKSNSCLMRISDVSIGFGIGFILTLSIGTYLLIK